MKEEGKIRVNEKDNETKNDYEKVQNVYADMYGSKGIIAC